jgi:hypothetical protein
MSFREGWRNGFSEGRRRRIKERGPEYHDYLMGRRIVTFVAILALVWAITVWVR